MKFQNLFNITLSVFSEVTESFSFNDYPLTACKCSFVKGVLRGKGYKGVLEMPMVSGFVKTASDIGLYNSKTEDVDVKLLLAGLDETLQKCEGFPFMGIKFTKKDLELWASRIREADKASSAKKEAPADDDD